MEATVEVGDVEVHEEVAVKVREEVVVELSKKVDTEAGPIRVDT